MATARMTSLPPTITAANVTILTGNGDDTVNTPDVGYAAGGDDTYCPRWWRISTEMAWPTSCRLDDNYSYAYMQGYGDGTFRLL